MHKVVRKKRGRFSIIFILKQIYAHEININKRKRGGLKYTIYYIRLNLICCL